MADLSGLGIGSFTQGLAGGLQTGIGFGIHKQHAEEYRKRTALEELQINALVDNKTMENAFKSIDKSTDPEAIQNFVDSLSLRLPSSKTTLQGYATATAERRKITKELFEESKEFAANPTSDLIARQQAHTSKIGVTLGIDSNEYKASKARDELTIKTFWETKAPAMAKEYMDNKALIEKIDEKIKNPKGGLLQGQEDYTGLKATLEAKNIDISTRLQYNVPQFWDRFSEGEGFKSKPTAQWVDKGYGKKMKVDKYGNISDEMKVETKPEKETKEKPASESNARLVEKSTVDAEAKILSNPEAPENEAYADFYNKHNPDFSYVKQEATGWGTKSKWVKVPKTEKSTGQPKAKSLKPDGKGGYIYQ